MPARSKPLPRRMTQVNTLSLYVWEDDKEFFRQSILEAIEKALDRLVESGYLASEFSCTLQWAQRGAPRAYKTMVDDVPCPPAPFYLPEVTTFKYSRNSGKKKWVQDSSDLATSLCCPWRTTRHNGPFFAPDCVILDVYEKSEDGPQESDEQFKRHLAFFEACGYPRTRMIVCSGGDVPLAVSAGMAYIAKNGSAKNVEALSRAICSIINVDRFGEHVSERTNWEDVRLAFRGQEMDLKTSLIRLDADVELDFHQKADLEAMFSNAQEPQYLWRLVTGLPQDASMDGAIYFCDSMKDSGQLVETGRALVLPLRDIANRTDWGWRLKSAAEIARALLGRLIEDSHYRRVGKYHFVRWDQVAAFVAMSMLTDRGSTKEIVPFARAFGLAVSGPGLAGWGPPNAMLVRDPNGTPRAINPSLTVARTQFLERRPISHSDK